LNEVGEEDEEAELSHDGLDDASDDAMDDEAW
jgi:hypothetical protein